MRALISSELSACLLMLWLADIAPMIAFINSSWRWGELPNCSRPFAAACAIRMGDSIILGRWCTLRMEAEMIPVSNCYAMAR